MALSLNKEHFHGHGHGHGHGHLSDTPMYARTHIHRVPNHLNEFCNHPVCRFPIPQTLALEGIKDLVFQGPQGFYYQPLKEGQLRLLVLLPSSFPQAPVRCRLISAIICELTDRFRYERVSGVSTISLDDSFQEAPDGEDPTTIQLNATQVRVSKKLESALKEFRDKSAELTFWVESLCVDQRNPIECAIQGLMMRCILFGADAVYLWVGETADGSELAFDLISTYDMAFEAHNTTSPDKDFAFLQLLLDPGHEAHWNGLTMMLQRQFWSQISTIQEIALARNAVLRCGKDSIPWVSARRFLKKCTAWTQYRVPPVVQLLAEMK